MKSSQFFSTENKKVPFSYFGDNFKSWFGDMDMQENGEKLGCKKLPRVMNDSEILAELKPEPVTLADVYETLKTMDNGAWATFYVKDTSFVLRAVHAFWFGDGWDFNAYPVTNPSKWSDGSQIFSRKFSLPSKTLPSAPDALSSDPLSLASHISALEKLMDRYNLK